LTCAVCLASSRATKSTYIAEAFSIAYDRDFDFDRVDLERFQRINHQGPEGIFLKGHFRRAHDVEAHVRQRRWRYPLFAAPFVAVGGLRRSAAFQLRALRRLPVVRRSGSARRGWGQVSGAVLGTRVHRRIRSCLSSSRG
jgi:hypothetical protein